MQELEIDSMRHSSTGRDFKYRRTNINTPFCFRYRLALFKVIFSQVIHLDKNSFHSLSSAFTKRKKRIFNDILLKYYLLCNKNDMLTKI